MKSGDDRPGGLTSITLLERLRQNDQSAWGQLLHLYDPLVQGWLRQMGFVGADADDLQQDVFQAVAAGLPGFRRDRAGDTFRGWLRTITRNKVLDFLRRRGRQPQGEGGTDAHLRLQAVPDLPLEEATGERSQIYHRALELLRSQFE